MKRRFEIILLDALWLSAMALFANFWFDIQFGFNLFSGAHWHYLAVQQLTPGHVLPLFYISMAGFFCAAIIGLYIINVPKLRKISFSSDARETRETKRDAPSAPQLPQDLQPLEKDPDFSPLPKTPVLPRPPRIVTAMHTQRMTQNVDTKTLHTASVSIDPNINEKLDEVFKSCGYIVKKPPKVGVTKLNLWAIGMGEVLYLGLADSHGGEITAAEGGESKWTSSAGGFTSPVWTITQAAEKIQALFSETLDSDIQITVRPFVVMNNATITNRESLQKIWDAFGAKVFESVDALREFLNDNQSREITEADKEDFDAYSEYIDTVADYFNKT